jgi:hypothetical protein
VSPTCGKLNTAGGQCRGCSRSGFRSDMVHVRKVPLVTVGFPERNVHRHGVNRLGSSMLARFFRALRACRSRTSLLRLPEHQR